MEVNMQNLIQNWGTSRALDHGIYKEGLANTGCVEWKRSIREMAENTNDVWFIHKYQLTEPVEGPTLRKVYLLFLKGPWLVFNLILLNPCNHETRWMAWQNAIWDKEDHMAIIIPQNWWIKNDQLRLYNNKKLLIYKGTIWLTWRRDWWRCLNWAYFGVQRERRIHPWRLQRLKMRRQKIQ